MSDPRQERMDSLRDEIRTCTHCEGMNIAKVTQAAPGWGSVRSPVVIVGHSLCSQCMATQIPFTGGSGRILEDISKAGIAQEQAFHHQRGALSPTREPPNVASRVERELYALSSP
jgi:uracil-DNA glycosylase